ncbi:MAG: hypothetical protein IT365_16770 [Candidatus Hydrogenedentes bacterium]|nr:hypothetical protein [Candidatus Hydrogenedentota bacterium]
MLKEKVFRVLTRIFLPSLARNMEEEGTFKVFEGENAISNEEDYFRIEDRGADVTVVIFSGMDVLFAGEPRFEMRKQLAGLGHNTNLVFVRDLRRLAYHVAPDGQPNGLEYYTRKLREIMNRLGAKHHVALGSSGGGSAAFYFGARCGMDHVIAFSPAFPVSVWTGWGPLFRAVADFKALFTRPSEYVEVLLVALSASLISHVIHKHIPANGFWDIPDAFESANGTRPKGTIFYGEQCGPDARQADLTRLRLPEVKLVPVPTGRHNCPGFLKERERLAPVLHEEIRTVLRERGFTIGLAQPPQERLIVETGASSVPEHG